MKITVMGCGYIGLPTAITFTLAGYEVCGFDVKDAVVETLNAGHIHIVEPGLQDAMTKAMAYRPPALLRRSRSRLTSLSSASRPPTARPRSHKRVSDMRFVESAGKGGRHGSARRANLCVLESTVASLLHAHGGARSSPRRPALRPEQFMTAHCPERIIPGNMMSSSCASNDRIIGSNTPGVGCDARSYIYEKVVDRRHRSA